MARKDNNIINIQPNVKEHIFQIYRLLCVSDNLTHMSLVSKFLEIGKQYRPRRGAIGVRSQKFHQKWGGEKA